MPCRSQAYQFKRFEKAFTYEDSRRFAKALDQEALHLKVREIGLSRVHPELRKARNMYENFGLSGDC